MQIKHPSAVSDKVDGATPFLTLLLIKQTFQIQWFVSIYQVSHIFFTACSADASVVQILWELKKKFSCLKDGLNSSHTLMPQPDIIHHLNVAALHFR